MMITSEFNYYINLELIIDRFYFMKIKRFVYKLFIHIYIVYKHGMYIIKFIMNENIDFTIKHSCNYVPILNEKLLKFIAV